MRLISILVIGVIALSFASILIKLCDAPAMVIASYRLTFAAFFFIASARLRKRNPFSLFSRRDWLIAGLSSLFLSLHFATWITSLKYTTVAISVVLVSTAPIFVALGSVIFLRERPQKWMIAGIGVTLVGCIIMSSVNFEAIGEHALGGSLLALVGAVGGAGYFLAGRELRSRIDTLTYVVVVYSLTAVQLLLVTLLIQEPVFGYDLTIYVLFILIAFVPQVIGHTTLNWALKRLSATAVSVTALGEPIGATILAFMILGEKITIIQAMGGILILTGVALTLRVETKLSNS